MFHVMVLGFNGWYTYTTEETYQAAKRVAGYFENIGVRVVVVKRG